jgi:MFS family permease
MPALALMTFVWAGAWLIVFAAGISLERTAAAMVFGLAAIVFGLGECLHGPTQGALVADLAPPRLRGRYMALSTLSWEIGFVIGPTAAGFILAAQPNALWPIAATVCVAAGFGALLLERHIPPELRLTPR